MWLLGPSPQYAALFAYRALVLAVAVTVLALATPRHVIAIGATMSKPDSAPPKPLEIGPETPHPAVVRVVVPEGEATSFGTGTLVAVTEAHGLVVTNSHVVRDLPRGQSVHVIFPYGFRSWGTVLATDDDWDLAAVAIWRPPVEPIPLAMEVPQRGDPLYIAGYGNGIYRMEGGICKQFLAPRRDFPEELVGVTARARQGDSGGPILTREGRLAGVLFGAGVGITTGAHNDRVRQFLNQAWPRFVRLPPPPGGVTWLPKLEPSPSAPNQNAASGDAALLANDDPARATSSSPGARYGRAYDDDSAGRDSTADPSDRWSDSDDPYRSESSSYGTSRDDRTSATSYPDDSSSYGSRSTSRYRGYDGERDSYQDESDGYDDDYRRSDAGSASASPSDSERYSSYRDRDDSGRTSERSSSSYDASSHYGDSPSGAYGDRSSGGSAASSAYSYGNARDDGYSDRDSTRFDRYVDRPTSGYSSRDPSTDRSSRTDSAAASSYGSPHDAPSENGRASSDYRHNRHNQSSDRYRSSGTTSYGDPTGERYRSGSSSSSADAARGSSSYRSSPYDRDPRDTESTYRDGSSSGGYGDYPGTTYSGTQPNRSMTPPPSRYSSHSGQSSSRGTSDYGEDRSDDRSMSNDRYTRPSARSNSPSGRYGSSTPDYSDQPKSRTSSGRYGNGSDDSSGGGYDRGYGDRYSDGYNDYGSTSVERGTPLVHLPRAVYAPLKR